MNFVISFASSTITIFKKNPGIAILIFWFIPRSIIWLSGDPVMAGDSSSYIDLAKKIKDMTFLTQHNGMRTPGLPLIILFCGFNYYLVWFINSLMVLAVSWMSYFITAQNTHGSPWAVIPGVVLSVSHLLFYEAVIMTEIPTMFFMLAALFSALQFKPSAPNGKKWLLLMGLALAAGSLVRPTVVALIPLIGLYLTTKTKDFRAFAQVVMLIFLPTFITVLSWSWVTYRATGVFSYSIITGYALAGHSGPILSKYRPPEWEHVGAVYSPLEEARIKNPIHGSSGDAVWDSREPLNQALGLTDVAQGALWVQMSVDLFRKFPGDYVRSVVRAWPNYWKSPKSYPFFEYPSLTIRRILYLHGLIFTCINVIAIIFSIYYIIVVCLHPRNCQFYPGAFLATSLLGTSLFITMLIPYPLARHGLPTISISATIVGIGLINLIQHYRQQKLGILQSQNL